MRTPLVVLAGCAAAGALLGAFDLRLGLIELALAALPGGYDLALWEYLYMCGRRPAWPVVASLGASDGAIVGGLACAGIVLRRKLAARRS